MEWQTNHSAESQTAAHTALYTRSNMNNGLTFSFNSMKLRKLHESFHLWLIRQINCIGCVETGELESEASVTRQRSWNALSLWKKSDSKQHPIPIYPLWLVMWHQCAQWSIGLQSHMIITQRYKQLAALVNLNPMKDYNMDLASFILGESTLSILNRLPPWHGVKELPRAPGGV